MAAAVAVIVAVVVVAAAMTARVYRPLVDTIMVGMKSMNVAVLVVLRLACTHDVGRYVLLVPTVLSGGTNNK